MTMCLNFMRRFLSEVGLVRIEDQKKELFPLDEAQVTTDTDELVKHALSYARARAEAEDKPELAADLSAEASQLQAQLNQDRGAEGKKAN